MKIAPLLFLALVGCAAPEPETWYRAGATEQDFNIAMARCRRQVARLQEPERVRGNTLGAGMRQAGQDLEFIGSQAQFMNDCLTAQGFHR
jgi:hypothetical protein